MGTSFEDLVTDSLRRRAAAVRIPAGLADLARSARRQHRRRQYLVRSGLTAVTAAGLAVVVPLATQAGPQARSLTSPAQTLADVVHHAERSITAVGATDVQVARDTFSGPGFVWFFPSRRRFVARSTTTWIYGSSARTEFYAAHGRPILDDSSVYTAAARMRERVGSYTGVDYVTSTWWHTLFPWVNLGVPAPPASCKLSTQVDLAPYWVTFAAPSVPWLRWDLRCGWLHFAGRQYVGKVDAIKIVSAHVPGAEVIWINPTTYLPMQSLLPGFGTADYRWLPATPRNLALLNAPIPAGFRQVKA